MATYNRAVVQAHYDACMTRATQYVWRLRGRWHVGPQPPHGARVMMECKP